MTNKTQQGAEWTYERMLQLKEGESIAVVAQGRIWTFRLTSIVTAFVKSGNHVMVIEENDPFFGECGEVTSSGTNGYGSAWAYVKFPNGQVCLYYANEIERVDGD